MTKVGSAQPQIFHVYFHYEIWPLFFSYVNWNINYGTRKVQFCFHVSVALPVIIDLCLVLICLLHCMYIIQYQTHCVVLSSISWVSNSWPQMMKCLKAENTSLILQNCRVIVDLFQMDSKNNILHTNIQINVKYKMCCFTNVSIILLSKLYWVT